MLEYLRRMLCQLLTRRARTANAITRGTKTKHSTTKLTGLIFERNIFEYE